PSPLVGPHKGGGNRGARLRHSRQRGYVAGCDIRARRKAAPYRPALIELSRIRAERVATAKCGSDTWVCWLLISSAWSSVRQSRSESGCRLIATIRPRYA